MLSAETSRRLACDAQIVTIKEDAEGATLDVGRARRSVPNALRRALDSRAPRCEFPGCDHERYLEAPLANGGLYTLQRWLDHDAREAQLVVVLAGSSQRMMQGLALEPSSPLFGRAGEILERLPPRGRRGAGLGWLLQKDVWLGARRSDAAPEAGSLKAPVRRGDLGQAQ